MTERQRKIVAIIQGLDQPFRLKDVAEMAQKRFGMQYRNVQAAIRELEHSGIIECGTNSWEKHISSTWSDILGKEAEYEENSQ